MDTAQLRRRVAHCREYENEAAASFDGFSQRYAVPEAVFNVDMLDGQGHVSAMYPNAYDDTPRMGLDCAAEALRRVIGASSFGGGLGRATRHFFAARVHPSTRQLSLRFKRISIRFTFRCNV